MMSSPPQTDVQSVIETRSEIKTGMTSIRA
jgi:hypothetical protein